MADKIADKRWQTIENVAVLSVVADRGLCGGYNTSVFRATDRLCCSDDQVVARQAGQVRRWSRYSSTIGSTLGSSATWWIRGSGSSPESS